MYHVIGGKSFYFVVFVDHFRRWFEVKVLTKETVREIIQFLKDFVIYRHGFSARIQMDGV